MPVRMVLVGHVRVRVAQGLVSVNMAVHASRPGMTVSMVRIVVGVRMLVLQRFVLMLVRMTLRKMKHDASDHQCGPEEHPHTAAALAKQERHSCTDEWSECENRAGPSSTERALRQQIKPQAQAVARCSDGD